MTMIKTAISLSDNIYEQMNSLAKQLDVPRSRLFAIAAEEFLQRYKKKDLIRKINEAVDNRCREEDKQWLAFAKQKRRQIIDKQW
jgi:metal-responsive CopG/Arc/MetJ family transcriptional regulator